MRNRFLLVILVALLAAAALSACSAGTTAAPIPTRTAAPSPIPEPTGLPAETGAGQNYVGFFDGGWISFTIDSTGGAALNELRFGVEPGVAKCAGTDQAPDYSRDVREAVAYTTDRHGYAVRNSTLDFFGRYETAMIMTGTLTFDFKSDNNPCGKGPVTWTAYAWPKTVDEAVEQLVLRTPAEDAQAVRALPRDQLGDYRVNMGMWIRGTFGLWNGNWDLLRSCGSEDMLPDDCSEIIIDAFWERLQTQ